ncbi:polymorphic toxin type 15 domain-containing protein [Roseinatronobacter alkalisoli]|uniref:polymorphic toxin type 15 domain-containing protein n=1 Tax=Roseinatronobacter alkalisoli TaxID=3028235 RepID=UPI003B678BF8
MGEAARPAARARFIDQNARVLLRTLPRNTSFAQARSIAEVQARRQDAIHTLDMVAGGHPMGFAGLGGRSENRSIGGQWGRGGKAGPLEAYAQDQCRNQCPRMQVQLSAT